MPIVYRHHGDGGNQENFLFPGIKACFKTSDSITDPRLSSERQQETDRMSPGSLPWLQREHRSTDGTCPLQGMCPDPARPHRLLELLLSAWQVQVNWPGQGIPGHTSEDHPHTTVLLPVTAPPANFPDGHF